MTLSWYYFHRHVFSYMCTIPNVYDLRGYGFSYAYDIMFPVVSHYITIITIHLVSQFLNRMKIDVTSNPVLHSSLEVVQDFDGCLTELANTHDGLQAGK